MRLRIQESQKVVADLRLRTKLLNVQLRTCGCGLRKLKFGCGFADCGLKKNLRCPALVMTMLLVEATWHTWHRPSMDQKSLIDFCIISSDLFSDVLDVRVKRGAELSTDQHLVVRSLRLSKPWPNKRSNWSWPKG